MNDIDGHRIDGAPGSASPSYTVVVEPREHEFEVAAGEPIMAAAHRAGLVWPTVCGGKASCTTCFIVVLDGADNLAPMTDEERTALVAVRARFPAIPEDRVRLACQARIRGPVRVRKAGVRKAQPPSTGD